MTPPTGRRRGGITAAAHRVSSFLGLGRSLQRRMFAIALLVAMVAAVMFSVVSAISVRSTLQTQAIEQAHEDFDDQATRAQTQLDSSGAVDAVAVQQLVTDLASTLQNEGSGNLMGVYVYARGRMGGFVSPVSTDLRYAGLISDTMRSRVDGAQSGDSYYQSVDVGGPGVMFGTVLSFQATNDIELYSLYSLTDQAQAIVSIQAQLVAVGCMLSLAMGVIAWVMSRIIIRPVAQVAGAAERLAEGHLDARVAENRNDEIGTLQHSFNQMADALNEKIDQLEGVGRVQRRFVSDVSHELRTPVTTIRMAADLLMSRKSEFDPMSERTVELLDDQISRFERMLAELLEISRYDAGNAQLDPVETDICQPVCQAVETVVDLARAKGVWLSVHLPSHPVVADIDARRIERIVRNLLGNAVDFAEGLPIEVDVVAGPGAASVVVRDHGVGMDASQLRHVFDRFWRADSSRSRLTGGTGLGLSIAMQDARLHHGDLSVRSLPGSGTVFILSLPLRAGMSLADYPAPAHFADDHAMRVMIRDDAEGPLTREMTADRGMPDESPSRGPGGEPGANDTLRDLVTGLAGRETEDDASEAAPGQGNDDKGRGGGQDVADGGIVVLPDGWAWPDGSQGGL